MSDSKQKAKADHVSYTFATTVPQSDIWKALHKLQGQRVEIPDLKTHQRETVSRPAVNAELLVDQYDNGGAGVG